MHAIHDGEIILQERYGSSSRERFYLKTPGQSNVVVIYDEKLNDVASFFYKVFLPQGYPDSVSKDYVAYQIWDTAQAFCSTITGILATQEVLRGVGVGDTSATPLAATITWVLKDGCGHIGRILFAFSHGTHLDAYSKKWRLYADTLNDAAMCIEIALPLFKNYTTFALCVSTVMKAVVGVAGGATRVAMTQHHAIRGNMADVSAKDSAQETAVNLIASFSALFIISVFGNSILIFVLMIILHITFNYLAVRAVCLRTLNDSRFLQVIDLYLRYEIIGAPCEINRNEPIVFYQLGSNLLDYRLCGFQIRVGCSLKKLVKENGSAVILKDIKNIYENNQYILIPNVYNRNMHVVLKEEASTDDILKSYFHAVLLSAIICAINDEVLASLVLSENSRPFALVCQAIKSAEWTKELINPDIYKQYNNYDGFRYEGSYDLMVYVNRIVNKEWMRVRAGLIQTGWDLSKHLLIVDEWRISSKKILLPQPISLNNITLSETINTLVLEDQTDERISPDSSNTLLLSGDETDQLKVFTIEADQIIWSDFTNTQQFDEKVDKSKEKVCRIERNRKIVPDSKLKLRTYESTDVVTGVENLLSGDISLRSLAAGLKQRSNFKGFPIKCEEIPGSSVQEPSPSKAVKISDKDGDTKPQDATSKKTN